MKGLIGILGGMGPAATVDIFNKFVTFTAASRDQEHIPLLISSIPDIPDRTQALLQGGPSPFTHLHRYLNLLQEGGAECIIIPCNTAHYWYPELQAVAKVPMISIVDSALQEAINTGQDKIGILATDATLSTGLYQKKMEQLGIECLRPDRTQQPDVMRSIYSLKAGRLDEAQQLLHQQVDHLQQRGAGTIILGCTEVPIILAAQIKQNPAAYIDATAALVRATIGWYNKRMQN